jgi:hypothetical protein
MSNNPLLRPRVSRISPLIEKLIDLIVEESYIGFLTFYADHDLTTTLIKRTGRSKFGQYENATDYAKHNTKLMRARIRQQYLKGIIDITMPTIQVIGDEEE